MKTTEKIMVSTDEIGIFYKRPKKKKQAQPIVFFSPGIIEEEELLRYFDRNITVAKLSISTDEIEWYNKYFSYELSNEILQEPNINYVILYTEDYDLINKIIKETNLAQISDFIYFLIYNIQKRQTNCFINDQKDLKINLLNIDKEISTFIELMKLLDTDPNDEEKPNPIQKSTFKLNGIRKHIELKNSSFVYDVFKMYRDELTSGSILNNWEKHLKAKTSELKSRLKSDLTLTNRISLALHLFLTENDFFKIKTGNLTTNKEILFISDIISMANLYSNKVDEGDAERMKISRLINQQSELPMEQRIKAFDFTGIDLSLLKEYFAEEIVNLGSTIKSKNVGYSAMGICNRFNIEVKERVWEIAHLIECIDIHLKRIGKELEVATEEYEDLQIFKNFIYSAHFGEIKSIKYQSMNDNTEYTIQLTQPIDLISHAVASYFNHYRLNLNIDIVNKKDGQYHFTEVQQQFLPSISFNLYRYAKEHLNLNDDRYSNNEIIIQFISRVIMATELFKQVEYAEPEVKELINFWLNSLDTQQA